MTPQKESDRRKTSQVVSLDPSQPGSARPKIDRSSVSSAVGSALGMIAPLWPLESFVAVNPLLGISERAYADADNLVDRIWGARLVMPRQFYADEIRAGKIERRHIEEALEELEEVVNDEQTVDTVYLLAFSEDTPSCPTPTVAEILSDRMGQDLHAFVIDRISFWAASYFDEGQAGWRSPWRGENAYAAWRGEAELDQTAEILGVPEFRSIVRTFPDDSDEMLFRAATDLGLQRENLDIYLQRLLATIAGWAGHARYRGWRQELAGGSDRRVKDLLAIRAAWDLALLEAFEKECPDVADTLRQRLTTPLHPDVAKCHVVNLVLHTAYEIAGREGLLDALAAGESDAGDAAKAVATRANAQAVFCIDVRSERFRRHLERSEDRIDTIGFAGFFGFALEVASIDESTSGARCPVLLAPQFLVRETVPGASESDVDIFARRTWLGRRVAAAWKLFGSAAISSFAFVESLGIAYAFRLIADSIGFRGKRGAELLVPSLESATVNGRSAGIPLEKRIDTAHSMLRGMSLIDNFARIVALIGHGSTTANNPYESRFHCGACGGHTGQANALVAAAVLNDPDVRAGLSERGIAIPADTIFVAGLHDTATDDVALFAPPDLPGSHAGDVQQLETALAAAGQATRSERAASFSIPRGESADSAIRRRSRDWSEVRPEWGLAGCLSFLAAPRDRSRHLDLEGRAFLHSYDWQADDDFEVLETIMTAPLMVAGWISLQYYASTIDNRVFGSGDKTLHNVVGGIGVLEGVGGDLRVGLPLQSLHDGSRFRHEPMRLNALIEAPPSAISEVLAKHESVRQLVDNGWIHLFAIGREGRSIKRYRGDFIWTPERPAPQIRTEVAEPARRSA